uniref:GUN4-like domain-containing protein n=1 Tax=Rhodomela confervoides TaxID=35163 RepID=A0A1Z1MA31_RHOCN|nr:hypothetical protein [Rhodomela confervoides]ARW62604.1 hypothetical protein [Rhodomela confervoides]
MKQEQYNPVYINKQINIIIDKNYEIISSDTEKIINTIFNKGEKEQGILLESIIQRIIMKKKNPDIIDGLIYQKLIETDKQAIKEKVLKFFPNGILTLKLPLTINYQPLQELLMSKKFQEADKLTQIYLCKLVEIKTKHKKEWLYFTDIQFLPIEDISIIDYLWKIYSKGKFGFSTQKKIWINNNKKWDKLWERINWINNENGAMRRYPQEFTWNLEAPEGHLPLFNQLRGTQTLSYLFNSIK